MKNKHPDLYCKQCGQFMNQNRQRTKRFCSANCRVKANRESKKLPPMIIALQKEKGNAFCLHCHEPFYRYTAKGKYCSVRCRVADHRLKHSA